MTAFSALPASVQQQKASGHHPRDGPEPLTSHPHKKGDVKHQDASGQQEKEPHWNTVSQGAFKGSEKASKRGLSFPQFTERLVHGGIGGPDGHDWNGNRSRVTSFLCSIVNASVSV